MSFKSDIIESFHLLEMKSSTCLQMGTILVIIFTKLLNMEQS